MDSSIGLQIKVGLNDTEAKEKLANLLKNDKLTLTFDLNSLNQMKAQMEQLSKIKFESLVVDESLKQVEQMTIDLKEQLEVAKELQKIYGQIGVPTQNQQQKEQDKLFKQAQKLQNQYYKEQEKMNKAVGEERKEREALIKSISQTLETTKSQITSQERLNKLENERLILENNRKAKSLDNSAKEGAKALDEQVKKTKELAKAEEQANQTIDKLTTQIYNTKAKQVLASETEKERLGEQVSLLEQMKQKLQEAVQIKNNKGNTTEAQAELAAVNEVVTARLKEQQLTEKIASAQSKKQQALDKDVAKAEVMVKNAQKEYDLKIKTLQAGRNGQYVDMAELQAFKTAVASLDATSTANVQAQLKQLSLQFRELTVNANVTRLQQVRGALSDLGNTFSVVTQYFSAAMIVRQFFTAMREGVQDIKDLDSAMTTLRITMEEFTETDISNLVNSAKEMSKELKINVSEVLESIKTVANANEDMESILNKSRPALILSNLTGLSTSQTVEMVQGALKQFSDLSEGTAEHAMKVADSMTAISKSLSMDFSTGVQGMSESISIIGSLANQAKMDIDETLSMVSAIAEKTRLSFSEVATALKSIMARTMRVKSADLGIGEEDFLKTERALNSVGVKIRDLTTGEMRGFRDIMLDLNDKWDNLNETAKSFVADSMGGAQRLSIVFAAIDATERTEELLEIARNGLGAAEQAQETWSQSLEAKFVELSNAATLFWQSFFDIETVSIATDLLINFVNGMTSLVETFGTVPTVVGIVSTSMLLFNNNLRQTAMTTMSSLIPAIGDLTAKMANHANGAKLSIAMLQSERREIISTIASKKAMGISTSTDTALLRSNTLQLALNTAGLVANKVAVIALQAAMSMGLSLAITAVISGLTSMITKMTQSSKVAAELAQETEEAYNQLRSGLESNADGKALISEYEQISQAIEEQKVPIEELKEAKNKLAEIEERLIELYPEASSQIDEQGKLVFGQIQDYKDLTEAERDYYEQKLQYLAMEASVNRSNVEAQIKENEEKLEKLQWKFNEHRKSQGQYEYGSSWHKEFGEMASEVAKEMATLSEETFELKQQLNTYDSVIKQANSSQNELIVSTNGLNKAQNDLADTTDKLNEVQETTEERASRLAKENKDAAESYIELTEDIQQAEEWLEKISENKFDMSDAKSMLGMFDEFVGDITNVADVQDFLNDKIKEMAQSQAEAYAEMRSQDEEFWNQKYKDSDDWVKYVDAVEKDIVNIVASSLGEQGQDFVNHIDQLGGFRDVDLSNVKNLADAKGKVESSLVEELKRMWAEYYKAQSAIITEAVRQDILKNNPNASIGKAAAMVESALKDLNAQNDMVTNLLENINTTVKPTYSGGAGQSYINKKPSSSSSSSSSSSTKKEVADLNLVIDRYYKLNDAINDVENALKRNQILQQTATPTQMVKLLREEVELYEKKRKAIQNLVAEQKKEAEELRKQLAKQGFAFDSSGDITNYASQLKKLQDRANSLTAERKESAIEAVKEVESLIKTYDTLINQTIPDTKDSYLELSSTIKEAERAQLEYVTNIQKQITDALKDELQKRYDETRKALEREKELYLSQYDEEDYNAKLTAEKRKLDEISQQISNLSRDTSLSAQLKLKDLQQQYADQLDAINQMIRDKEKENGSNAFDNLLDELDEKLENALDEKSLASMVNQALTKGFISLDGEIIQTENLLTQMLERSGDAFTVLGDTLRTELIEGLQVAKGLISEIGKMNLGGVSLAMESMSSKSRSIDIYDTTTANLSRSANLMSGSQMAQTIQVTFDKLLNVEGNFDSALMSDVERMINTAKDEVTYAISRALSTY